MSNGRVAWCAAAAGLLSAVFHAGGLPWWLGYSDIIHLFPLALDPGWPYLDRLVEYPVLTGLLMKVLGLLGGGVPGYYALTAAVLTGACAAVGWLLAASAGPEAALRRWSFSLSLIPLLVFNWDVMPVLCSVAALMLAERKRAAACGAALALGFCFKLYPALYLAPLLVAWRADRKRSLLALGSFALTALALNLPFAAKNFSGWSYCFSLYFSSRRLANPDSIWAVLRYLTGGPDASFASVLAALALALLLPAVLWRLRDRDLWELCGASTIVLLLCVKIFSPQYALWLLPFFAVLRLPALAAWGFEAANLGVLFSVLPFILASRSPVLYQTCAAFVVLRHLCLAALLADLFRRAGQQANQQPRLARRA